MKPLAWQEIAPRLALGLGLASLWVSAAPLWERLGPHQALPAVQAEPAPPLDLYPVLDFAPFGRAETATDPGFDAIPGLGLLGITMASPPDLSRAILTGGTLPIGSYGKGDQVAPGVILAGVFADHVVIEIEGGAPQVLSFVEGEALVTRAPASQAPTP